MCFQSWTPRGRRLLLVTIFLELLHICDNVYLGRLESILDTDTLRDYVHGLKVIFGDIRCCCVINHVYPVDLLLAR